MHSLKLAENDLTWDMNWDQKNVNIPAEQTEQESILGYLSLLSQKSCLCHMENYQPQVCEE